MVEAVLHIRSGALRLETHWITPLPITTKMSFNTFVGIKEGIKFSKEENGKNQTGECMAAANVSMWHAIKKGRKTDPFRSFWKPTIS
jgi:hypothetical protein